MQQVRRSSRSSRSCSRIGTSYRPLYSFDTLPLPTRVDPSDTLGRPKELTRKKDFSDSDLKMALNAGILFETPEKFFLNASQRIHSHFDVSGSIRLCDVVRHTNGHSSFLKSTLVSRSASGISSSICLHFTIYRTILK
jgi:Polynucleotide kinase 3 phosphatase